MVQNKINAKRHPFNPIQNKIQCFIDFGKDSDQNNPVVLKCIFYYVRLCFNFSWFTTSIYYETKNYIFLLNPSQTIKESKDT
jgi:hypothetical protein